MRGERQVDIMAIGIEDTRAHDGRFEIVVTDDHWHPAEITEGPLVQPEKCLEFLIPDRFLVAVSRMAQGHPKHPGPSPFAGRGVERRRAAKKIDLPFGTRRTVKDADSPAGRRDRPYESLDRLVARAVPVLFDQILPDPLQAQAGVEFLSDRRAIQRCGEPRARSRAGERFGRF